MKRQMILLSNLNCPVCAGKLEDAAKRLPGMKSARVVFGTGALHVEYDASQLTHQAIADVIRKMGLDVTTTI